MNSPELLVSAFSDLCCCGSTLRAGGTHSHSLLSLSFVGARVKGQPPFTARAFAPPTVVGRIVNWTLATKAGAFVFHSLSSLESQATAKFVRESLA